MSATRMLDVVVVGLGYVGQNLLLAAKESGLEVAGVDSSASRVDGLLRGQGMADGVDAKDVSRALRTGLIVTKDPRVISRARSVVVCVPTPLTADGQPDHSAVVAAVSTIASHRGSGALIVIESTVAVGTTDGIVLDILRADGSECGKDFFLAFAPERINPGDAVHTMAAVPRVIGGIDEESSTRAYALYAQFVEKITVLPSTREAELAKLIENTYRYVNIALVNELAGSLEGTGIDLNSAIEGAATKPYGFEAFYPGPGIGGHCIPVDPVFLQSSLAGIGNFQSSVLTAAHAANDRKKEEVYETVLSALRSIGPSQGRKTVCIVGVGYKAGVRDTRNSPAVDLAERLYANGVLLRFFDDVIENLVIAGTEVERIISVNELVADSDLIVRMQETSVDSAYSLINSSKLLDLRPGQGAKGGGFGARAMAAVSF